MSTKPIRLDVEAFTLSSGESAVHFESDPDLYVGCSRALGNVPGKRSANQAALVLIELGIDGNEAHRVRVERTGNFPGPNDDAADYEDAFNYPRGDNGAAIIRDSIAALRSILGQLEEMVPVAERRRIEANIWNSGAECGQIKASGTDDDTD